MEKHIEIRGKPIPFIRKAKRILRVTVKGVHPEVTDDMLLYELEPFVDHCSSIKHNEIHHHGTTFRHGKRQVFVTHLARHIPRSIKIGHRWCLVFYRGQPEPPGRPAQQTPVIQVTPPTDALSDPMDVGQPGPGTSVVNELSEATSEESGTSLQIVADEPMPEASHTSKRVREPEESKQQDKKISEKKKKKKKFTTDEEFEGCLAHISDIVEELESSNFTNIRETLGMNPTMEVERAIGTMVVLAGSSKREWEMPSNCRRF